MTTKARRARKAPALATVDLSPDAIRADLAASGLTQDAAAARIGITSRALRNYLAGRRTPGRAIAAALAGLAGRKVRL
jgi:transcriptional regulator with XRE-family HTH domain